MLVRLIVLCWVWSCLWQDGLVEFHELVNALVCLDPETPHLEMLEKRISYIFRVYDADGDGSLAPHELCAMLRHLVRLETGMDAPLEVLQSKVRHADAMPRHMV